MKNALILLAGGMGKRTGLNKPKQFIKFGNTNLIEYFLLNLKNDIFDIVVIACKNKEKNRYLNSIVKKFIKHRIIFALSGTTRQISVNNSLNKLKRYKPKNVLIHDSARPLASNRLINKIIKNLEKNFSCIPYTTNNDLIKTKIKSNLTNKQILNIQTPQGFHYKKILDAHETNKDINIKDDSTLIEQKGLKLKMIYGEIKNFKITTREDIDLFNLIKYKNFRSGIGYDIHKINYKSKKKLTLCGVKFSHPPLIGHSDADVGYHAICDSILGSLSMRDIGYYFNNKKTKWKNANSKIFIIFCSNKLKERGYKIINLDINFICETPNINKNVLQMKKNLSKLLDTSLNKISIKATTNEKISFIGRGEGIAAESIVQISNV